MLNNIFDRLKSALETTKNAVLYVILPILSVFAYIFYLKNKNKALQDYVDNQNSMRKLEGLKDEAKSAEEDYKHVRDEYLRNEQLRNESGDKDPVK